MDKIIFGSKKEELINLITECLDRSDTSKQNKIALIKLLELLKYYSFENRLEKKGLLAHAVVDSLDDYSIGEKVIEYDNNIR